jgi:RimJ/RimL family protein N-acetyltransferase
LESLIILFGPKPLYSDQILPAGNNYEAVQRIFAAHNATWGTLQLQVYTDNGPAFRLYEKSGFAVEGTLLQFAIRDGQYVDAYMMARVRESQSP